MPITGPGVCLRLWNLADVVDQLLIVNLSFLGHPLVNFFLGHLFGKNYEWSLPKVVLTVFHICMSVCARVGFRDVL